MDNLLVNNKKLLQLQEFFLSVCAVVELPVLEGVHVAEHFYRLGLRSVELEHFLLEGELLVSDTRHSALNAAYLVFFMVRPEEIQLCSELFTVFIENISNEPVGHFVVDMTVFAVLVVGDDEVPVLVVDYLVEVAAYTVLVMVPAVLFTVGLIGITQHYTVVSGGFEHLVELLLPLGIVSIGHHHDKVALFHEMCAAPEHIVVRVSDYHELGRIGDAAFLEVAVRQQRNAIDAERIADERSRKEHNDAESNDDKPRDKRFFRFFLFQYSHPVRMMSLCINFTTYEFFCQHQRQSYGKRQKRLL